MEFLDSLDLDTIDKKSHRVRSWYLYEQYKSLERNQLDAAQKLKDRSYQERILRQELSERRARRKLYDQFGLCQSESRLKKKSNSDSTKTSVSASITSNDDFFESFCDLQEDELVTQVTGTELSDETFGQDCLSASKCCIDDFKSVEDHKDDNCSFTGSINSVVENLKPFTDDYQQSKETEFAQNSIAEDINLQLDSVKEDILCLEKYAKLEDVDKISEDSLTTVDIQESPCQIDEHVMPYVSPIKFATDELDMPDESLENVKRKKSVQSRKCRKIFHNKPLPKKMRRSTKQLCSHRKYSEYCLQPFCKHTYYESRTKANKHSRASEPWRSAANLYNSKDDLSQISSSSSSIWPEFLKEKPFKYCRNHCCCYHKRAVNPMLKIAQYIDSILKDIDEYKHM